MSEGTLHNELHYTVGGKGPGRLLLFHGFGQDNSTFDLLINALADEYTCYSFDLFYHGKSYWITDSAPFTKDDLKRLIYVFLVKHKIEKFDTLGFSIGSRLAMACAELFPEKTNTVYLLAPDFISPSIWYSLATSSLLTRSIFKYLTYHPTAFQHLLTLARKTSLINAALFHFASKQMNSKDKRKKVYLTWMVFRKLSFRLTAISEIISYNKIKLVVILGTRDKVIPKRKIMKLKKYIHDFNPIELNCTHHQLTEKVHTCFRKD